MANKKIKRKKAFNKNHIPKNEKLASYSSFMLGLLTIAMLILFFVTFFGIKKNLKTPQKQISTQKTVSQAVSPSPSEKSEITQSEYVVKKGDDLWDIAVRAYADGYKWVDIARVNNLSNPDLIHPGNVFKIPR